MPERIRCLHRMAGAEPLLRQLMVGLQELGMGLNDCLVVLGFGTEKTRLSICRAEPPSTQFIVGLE
jgi:hypothetical protein